MSDITIYHNPDCGTSRNTLAMIRNSGAEPQVMEYLKTPPDRATLERLIAAMGITPRALLRQKSTPYDALGLGSPTWTDAQLIDFMLQEANEGARHCAPGKALDIITASYKLNQSLTAATRCS